MNCCKPLEQERNTNMPLFFFFYRFVAQFGSSGQYRCEAVNDAGFDRMEMSLQVFGKMCYHRHHIIDTYCRTVCVCVSVLVTMKLLHKHRSKGSRGSKRDALQQYKTVFVQMVQLHSCHFAVLS